MSFYLSASKRPIDFHFIPYAGQAQQIDLTAFLVLLSTQASQR